MRKLIVTPDNDPNAKYFFSNWEVESGRVEGSTLTAKLRNKSKLIIEAIDVELVADIIFSHDPGSEIVKGKIGITSVVLEEPSNDSEDTKEQFVKALKALMRELEN